MDLTGDIFVHGHVEPMTLTAATARALEQSPFQVGYRAPEAPWPRDVGVVIASRGDDLPGDWPVQFQLLMPNTNGQFLGDRLRRLSRALGLPIMTGADTFDPFIQILTLPDGSMHEVSVMQADDGGFYDTPEMTRLIAGTRPTSLRLAS